MFTTLIRNATVVLPDATVKTDVLIDGATIAEIDPAVQVNADETIDATGLHLLPGMIDTHVHFREPGAEYKEGIASGSRACAKGGVTTFLEMPNTNPATTTREALHAKLELASRESIVNYGFYLGATPDNLEELKQATRTPGIKLFLGSSTGNLLVDGQDALERIFAETTLPICAHCEDEAIINRNAALYPDQSDPAVHSKIRTTEAAVEAVRRAVALAQRHNHPLQVAHVSSGDEVELIAAAAGLVTAEACPHHLLLNVDDYPRLGTLAKMNPSLKTADDNRRLWKALLDGSIQAVVTDHAPHLLEEKSRPYPEAPAGVPSVENSLSLMLDQVNRGRCTLENVVQWMSTASADIWGLVGKGRIAVGADADLVLVDMDREFVIRNEDQQTRCGWSPWNGQRLVGQVVRTIVLGQTAFSLDSEPLFNTSCAGGEVRFARDN